MIKKFFFEQVYDTLKDEIRLQKITLGDRLVNQDLQLRFGVSSTPIRDAINRLYMEGLVDEITRTGAKVVSFSPVFAFEINEIISMVSVKAIQMSFQRSDNMEMVKLLKEQLDLQVQNMDNDLYFEYDNSFHRIFIDYSGNERFCKLYEQYSLLQEMLIRYYYKHQKKPLNKKRVALKQHTDIITAFESKDVILTQKYMQEHHDVVSEVLKGMETQKL